MAWAKATIEIRPASVGTGIKCGLRKTSKSLASMTISINATVGADMGLSDGDKIEVMLGDGEHHGLIRLRKNNSAGQVAAIQRDTGKGKFFLLKLGHQPAFIDRSESSAWCQWEKDDGWIEIVLPKWADETAPNRKRPPNGMTPLSGGSSGNAPAQRGRNVTASIMGDPEPGRREAVEKIGRKEMLAKMGEVAGK